MKRLAPLLLLAGCVPNSGVLVGPDGGTVCVGDAACVEIPAGAVDADVDITVTPYDGPRPGGTVGEVFDFGPDGTVFAAPVTLTLRFLPGDVPAGASLTMGWLEGAEFFALDDFEIDLDGGVARGRTTHFTPYLNVGGGDLDADGYATPLDCDDGDARVYPGAPEALDGRDNDCDGQVDEDTFNCGDGVDNDGDGWIDDDDPDCTPIPESSEQGYGDTACNNGLDDDGDGLADADDSGCVDGRGDDEEPLGLPDLDGDGYDASVDCDDSDPLTHPGASEALDGRDNDCDGQVDEDTFNCGDGVDNDGDGWTDGQDPDCTPIPESSESGYGTTDCNNGMDDDMDGLVDADDEGCDDAGDIDEGPSSLPDMDGDGFDWSVDCDDQDANTWPGAPEIPDRQDNDCDGLTDEGTPNCADGLDNDGDGWIDMDDEECSDVPEAAESGPGVSACSDGLDNDGDGQTDADDPGCTNGYDNSEE